MLSVFISLHLLVVKFFKVGALYAIVHGADAEETAQRISMGLKDQVHQHYSSFSEDAGYVLRDTDICLPLVPWSNDYLCRMTMSIAG